MRKEGGQRVIMVGIITMTIMVMSVINIDDNYGTFFFFYHFITLLVLLGTQHRNKRILLHRKILNASSK